MSADCQLALIFLKAVYKSSFIHIIFKADESKAKFFTRITPIICAPVYIELMQGATQSNRIRNIIQSYLDQFMLVHINEEISVKTLKLMLEYGNRHGLQMSDAFNDANAIVRSLPIYTLNVRDFTYIAGIDIFRK